MSADQVKEKHDSNSDSQRVKKPLILASGSVYRRQMIERLQVAVRADAPGIDESRHDGESPRTLSVRLAAEKAAHMTTRYPDHWVLGSDQVAMLGDEALGKPGSVERARQQLRACSGRTVEFQTAMCLLGPNNRFEHLDTTRVRFRQLTPSGIDDYLRRESALDCAGSFKSEGFGITLTESIESEDPTALIGLPLIVLARWLRTIGMLVS